MDVLFIGSALPVKSGRIEKKKSEESERTKIVHLKVSEKRDDRDAHDRRKNTYDGV